MKILFFGADYPPTGGGIATFSYELIHFTSKHDEVEKIKVVIFGNSDPRSEKLDSKIDLITYKKINFFYTGWKTLFVFIKNKDYDIFHSLNLFPIGFWIALWSKVFRKKSLVTFYGTDACDARASKKTLILKKWTISNVLQALTISEFTKNQTNIKYKFKDNLIKVIYPIVPKALLSSNYTKNNGNGNSDSDVLQIKNSYSIDNNTFVIISVARLVKRKGTEFLIKAVSKINDDNIKLFIIGNGPEKENLTKLVTDLNLNNKVFILGKVDDIIPYYNLAHVSVLPSYMMVDDGDFEGLGLVLLEAQSYGVSVIGTRSGGIPEAFDDGITGILVEEQDIEGLEKALIKLKDNRELLNTFSSNTKSFLEKRFGYDNTINKYIELCKSL